MGMRGVYGVLAGRSGGKAENAARIGTFVRQANIHQTEENAIKRHSIGHGRAQCRLDLVVRERPDGFLQYLKHADTRRRSAHAAATNLRGERQHIGRFRRRRKRNSSHGRRLKHNEFASATLLQKAASGTH